MGAVGARKETCNRVGISICVHTTQALITDPGSRDQI
jgi:hypothetical protein